VQQERSQHLSAKAIQMLKARLDELRQQRAHLWQADRLSCSVSEVDRHNTIFTLAATPLACSAVMHSKHPDGQQP
jgi:protein subunit release factor A